MVKKIKYISDQICHLRSEIDNISYGLSLRYTCKLNLIEYKIIYT